MMDQTVSSAIFPRSAKDHMPSIDMIVTMYFIVLALWSTILQCIQPKTCSVKKATMSGFHQMVGHVHHALVVFTQENLSLRG